MEPESAKATIEMLNAYKHLFQPESNPFTPWIPVVSALIGGLTALGGNAFGALWKSRQERKAIEGMIVAEIVSITLILKTRAIEKSMRAIVTHLEASASEEEQKDSPESKELPQFKRTYNLPAGYNKIYLANGDKLGLLAAGGARRVVTFYAMIDSFLSDVGEGGALHVHGYAWNYTTAIAQLKVIEEIANSIIEVRRAKI